VAALAALALPARADVGDPQVRTDHPWYPGEMACSTFARLFATQAADCRRVVGVEPKTEEQKALASWFWRNTVFAIRRSRSPGSHRGLPPHLRRVGEVVTGAARPGKGGIPAAPAHRSSESCIPSLPPDNPTRLTTMT
jgi:hypothetical protein